MHIEVETVDELRQKLHDISCEMRDLINYINAVDNVLFKDDGDGDTAGYSRIIEIIESKISDMVKYIG